jgi:predicted Ser/Thr protein kinase
VAETLAAGARIGSYEVLDCLGRGGMGVVYRARDTRLGRTVALKVLHSDDPELLRRLDREARAASALNHPNIVQIYDVGVAAPQEGEHYVVMEYVEGETLRARLAPGPLPLPELLDLGAQLADGLAKAHRAGIVHRDLKPENLIVNPDGLLKILDFGLAKVLPAPLGDLDARETLTRHATQAGTLLGTLEYMSPEQASGRAVDSRTDQFTVGLILCEMATGRAVFHRETPAQVLAAVIERDAEPLGRMRPDAPPALEAVISRCLQKDPERRFTRTDDLAAELAKLAGRSRVGSLAEAELVPAVPEPLRPGARVLYHVQTGFSKEASGGKIRRYDEGELARQIRRGKLTGVELVRRDDEEGWQPLYESRVFRREVPTFGDPRDAARWRLLRALGGHFTGFFIVGIVMYSTQGHLPFWMGIWGVVLAAQVHRRSPRRPRGCAASSSSAGERTHPGCCPRSMGSSSARRRWLCGRRTWRSRPPTASARRSPMRFRKPALRWSGPVRPRTAACTSVSSTCSESVRRRSRRRCVSSSACACAASWPSISSSSFVST